MKPWERIVVRPNAHTGPSELRNALDYHSYGRLASTIGVHWDYHTTAITQRIAHILWDLEGRL